MLTETELPRYQCHKQVWALQIKEINELADDDGGAEITPFEIGYGPFIVDREYMSRHRPHVGGYVVVYADGYKSFSPAKAFEEGYTKIEATVLG